MGLRLHVVWNFTCINVGAWNHESSSLHLTSWEVSPNKTVYVFALSQTSTDFERFSLLLVCGANWELIFFKDLHAIRHQNIRPNVLNDRVGREYFNNDVVENRHLSPVVAAGGLVFMVNPFSVGPAASYGNNHNIVCDHQPWTIQIFTHCKWHIPNLMDDRVELSFTKSGLQEGKKNQTLIAWVKTERIQRWQKQRN